MGRRSLLLLVLVILVAGHVGAAPQSSRSSPDRRAILKQAKAAHYSLRQRGLVSFVVDLNPNWDVVLEGRPKTRESMLLLKGLRFSLTFTQSGTPSLRYGADIPAPTAGVQAGFDMIYSAMRQIIVSFFTVYSPFMVTSPFPADGNAATVDPIDVGYRVTWTEDNGARVVIVRMTKSLAIIDMAASDRALDSVVTPTFTKTIDGYILSAYNGTFKSKGASASDVRIEARIDHTLVKGLFLPSTLVFDATVGGVLARTELTFTNYIVATRR